MVVFMTHAIGCWIDSFGHGLLAVSMPRYIEETVPKGMFSFSMAVMGLAHGIAGFLGVSSTLLLPPDDDTEALKDSETFRWVFAIQGIFALICLTMGLTIFKLETTKWYLTQNDRENAEKAIEFNYKTGGETSAFCDKILSESTLKTSSVTFKQAYFER